ncbi:MAG: hypothetical protein LBP21_03665 [Synergistaceae bacterium]|nr:hypothetical protein [Synergistaceae bacterium]
MKKTWRIIVVLAILWISTKSWAETRGYRPVVFACEWDSGISMWLMGGFKEGKWYEHTALPIKVNGRAITPEEGIELVEPVACATPFVREGTRLVFYSTEGQKIGLRTVKETKYSCSPASAETFIDVEMAETEDLKMSASAMAIGVSDGWDAVSAPTRRKTEKGNIVFALDSPALSVTFSPATDEYGDKIYKGVLMWGEKNLHLTDAYVEEEKELKGFFIDLNGDEHVEFVLHSQNIGGFVSVFELSLDGENPSAIEVLSLDLGD